MFKSLEALAYVVAASRKILCFPSVEADFIKWLLPLNLAQFFYPYLTRRFLQVPTNSTLKWLRNIVFLILSAHYSEKKIPGLPPWVGMIFLENSLRFVWFVGTVTALTFLQIDSCCELVSNNMTNINLVLTRPNNKKQKQLHIMLKFRL